MDFSAEVERSLWALDGAVLVISAAEGVQPQTELLFEALKAQALPVIIFVNKTDIPTVDMEAVMDGIARRLSARAVRPAPGDALVEALADVDDGVMARYLEGETIPDEEQTRLLRRCAQEGSVFPVLTGSALRGLGVEALLDGVVEWLPAPKPAADGLSGIAFATLRDKVMGRGLWVRLYSGRLQGREAVSLPGRPDPLTGETPDVEQKITRLRDADGSDIDSLGAGEIGVVFGLSALKVGQILGDQRLLPRKVQPGALRAPVMTVGLAPENQEDMPGLAEACGMLAEEDPLLQVRYERTTGELHMSVMGAIQIEILQETLLTRFGLKVSMTEPTIIYRETVKRPATGYAEYTWPKPCWAILRFDVKPGPRGSGVQYRSVVPAREILPRYQHQVEQALTLALSQGRLGWQVTDVDITLTGGSHHQFHTHPLDFIVATPWGIQDALRNAGSVLLEPIWEWRIRLPQTGVGRVMSDATAMRGEVTDVASDGENAVVTALLPVKESMDYSVKLAQLSAGRAAVSLRLHGYRECPVELGASAPRRGVDPLDTSKYILAARNALSAGIYDG